MPDLQIREVIVSDPRKMDGSFNSLSLSRMMTVVKLKSNDAVGGRSPTTVPENNSSASRTLSSSIDTLIHALG